MNEQAVNIQTRRQYAQLLRRFLAGKLTTDEYEDAYFAISDRHGRDAACACVFFNYVWFLYDDITPHRMTGRHRIGPEARSDLARVVLFLRTNTPFDGPRVTVQQSFLAMVTVGTAMLLAAGTIVAAWPTLTPFVQGVVWLLVAMASGPMIVWVGLSILRGFLRWLPTRAGRVRAAEHAHAEQIASLWPFASESDFNAARQTPTFLCGGRVKCPQAC